MNTPPSGRKYSQTADTLLPPPMEAQPKPPSHTPMALNSISLPGNTKTPEQNIADTSFPIKSMIGSTIAGALIAGGVGYCVMTGYNPFEKKSEATVSTAPSASAAPDKDEHVPDNLPTTVNSSEDLRKIIEAYNLKLKPSDFAPASGRNSYFDGLRFNPELDEQGRPVEPLKFNWLPMDSKRFTDLRGDDMIIATMLKNAKYASALKNIGIKPQARYTDAENPLITYHYYRCVNPGSAGVASIVIEDQNSRRERNLSLYRLKLPTCTENSTPKVQ